MEIGAMTYDPDKGLRVKVGPDEYLYRLPVLRLMGGKKGVEGGMAKAVRAIGDLKQRPDAGDNLPGISDAVSRRLLRLR